MTYNVLYIHKPNKFLRISSIQPMNRKKTILLSGFHSIHDKNAPSQVGNKEIEATKIFNSQICYFQSINNGNMPVPKNNYIKNSDSEFFS